MKKSFITLSITFLIAFTAFGQSVEINPFGNNQIFTKYGNNPALIARRANGTDVSPTAVGADNTLFFLGGYGHTGTAFPAGSNAAISFRTSQPFSPTANGTYIIFETTPNNTINRLERMRITDVGNVGIGTQTPNGNLSFSNTNNNRKILLYEDANNDHQFLGFGVNPRTLRYQIPSTTNSHVFYVGTSPTASTELMRITGTGNVGIGTATPTAKLEVNGFTKLGTDAPSIKVKKLIGTTAASEGANVSVAHGLTRSKIISATVLVDDGTYSNSPNSPIAGVNFYFDISATNVIVYNSTTQSELILSKSIVIMITYEE